MLARFGNTPTQLEIQVEIPAGHDRDGDGIGNVAIHPEKIELQVQQRRVEREAGQADQLELCKAAQPQAKRTSCLRVLSRSIL